MIIIRNESDITTVRKELDRLGFTNLTSSFDNYEIYLNPEKPLTVHAHANGELWHWAGSNAVLYSWPLVARCKSYGVKDYSYIVANHIAVVIEIDREFFRPSLKVVLTS